MKKLKILFIVMVLFGATAGVQAHKIKVHHKHGTVVAKVHHPKVLVHKGVNYYYANGIWYRPYGRKYVVSRAPIGIRVKYLPRGFRKVRINGIKYYTYNGVWYTKNRGYFTVVRVS